MANRGDRPSGSRPAWQHGIHAHVHIPAVRIPMSQPRLEARAGRNRQRYHSLRRGAGPVGLEKHGDPVVRSVGGLQEPDRCRAIYGHDCSPHPVFVSVTRPVNVEFVNVEQSTPEKSASMVSVSAFPTLSSVPTHPLGDWY